MGDRPWFKFYATDWRADQALRLCSAAARGLWIECLCLMHEAEPYGHLLVSGRAVSDAQLASLTGIPARQLAGLISELETAGVFTRGSDGVITSRRMVRDAAKAREGAINGKRGGNPALVKPDDNAGVKGEVIGGGSPRGQKPEAIIQNQNQNQNQNQKDSDLEIFDLSSSGLAESNISIPIPRRFGASQPWTPEQKKAAWQSRVCAWAQCELSTEAYGNFLNGWANGERWAQLKAEEFSTAMNAARARKSNGGL